MHSSLVFLLLFKLLIFFLWFSSYIYPLYGNCPQGFIPAHILFLFQIISTVATPMHPVIYAGGSHSLIPRLTSPEFQIFISYWLLATSSWISHRNHVLSIALILPPNSFFLFFLSSLWHYVAQTKNFWKLSRIIPASLFSSCSQDQKQY